MCNYKLRKKLFTINGWIMMASVSIIILLPLYWIFISSIMTSKNLLVFPIRYIPVSPTLASYKELLREFNFIKLFQNTMIITFFEIIICIFICLLAAYAFNRIPFKGSSFVLGFILVSAILPSMSMVIPMFQFYKFVKLYDTFVGIIILFVSNLIPFTTIVSIAYLRQIPVVLEEAASIDGANLIDILSRIIFPVIKPAIAVLAILNFILVYDDFMTPLIFSSSKAQTLICGILNISRNSEYDIPWDKISAYSMIMMIPIIIFVIVMQRQIMDGIIAGGVKG